MSTSIPHTRQRRGPWVASALAMAAVCIGLSALCAGLVEADLRGTDRVGGAAVSDAASRRVGRGVARPPVARLRLYVGADDPFSEFAQRPLQGWLYAYGSPGPTDRLNWDPVSAPARPAADAAQAPRTLKVHFEVEVSALPSRTRGGTAHVTHTARFHWELPAAVGGDDSASARSGTSPRRFEAELPTAALTLLSLALLPALRRRWQLGEATARGSPLH